MEDQDNSTAENHAGAVPRDEDHWSDLSTRHCVVCGQLTPGAVSRHRCWDCRHGGLSSHCPGCGYNIRHLIDDAVVTRWQEVREFTQDWWLDRGGYVMWRRVERVLEARRAGEAA